MKRTIVNIEVPCCAPESVFYDAIGNLCSMACVCGYVAQGTTWEDTGADMDNHLDEEESSE